jgi:hypothetical protein
MPEPAINSDMATAETWTPSRRIRAAAVAENDRVERELARLAARERELAAEMAAVQGAREELQHQRNVLNHFTNGHEPAISPRSGRTLRALPSPALAGSDGTTLLKGASIRETAVRILAVNQDPDRPVHYRDWFELLTAQGFMPGGKDPLATFLTQISRSPLVKRTTSAGVYVLDHEFTRRARKRLTSLAEQLSETQALSAQDTVEQIATARERRARLTAEIQETERQLHEALRSLGETGA